jgi:hypothetical protein
MAGAREVPRSAADPAWRVFHGMRRQPIGVFTTGLDAFKVATIGV